MAASAISIDTTQFDYCPRMRVKAMRLPCGEREECEGCEYAAKRKRHVQGKDSPFPEYAGRKCAMCGKDFIPATRQKYCSKSCRQKAAYKKKKAGLVTE